jgi:hypothetical protein
MTEIKTIADKESFDAARRVLSEIPGGLGRAGVRAANKTAMHGRTISAKAIIAKYPNLKPNKIKKNMYVNRANKKWSAAQLKIKSKGLSLIGFGAKQTSTGVETTIGSWLHAFLAPTSTKAAGYAKEVFRRIGIFRIMTKGRYQGKRREAIQIERGLTSQDLLRRIPGAVNGVRSQMAQKMMKEMAAQTEIAIDEAQKRAIRG